LDPLPVHLYSPESISSRRRRTEDNVNDEVDLGEDRWIILQKERHESSGISAKVQCITREEWINSGSTIVKPVYAG
jgi:hypothetical protein